jgi:ectoine hydroxylase-related dioxygenase (phytanoyl-CoA dioxygenase family)
MIVQKIFLAFLLAGASVKGFVIPSRSCAQANRNQIRLFMSDVSGMLYQEQEKLIVSRGELEEEMMSKTAKPLETIKIKIRGAGGGGGFGGSSSSRKGKNSSLKAEGKEYAKVLKKKGVVRIDNVLSNNVADAMREYVYALRKKSETEVAAGDIKSIQRFADVLLKKDRCDLTLPFGEDIITEAMNEALRESAVAQTIVSILGKDATLYEFSTLISDPGSQRQCLHPDTPFLEDMGPVLFTVFIALQDIRLDMGPTTFLPGTHTLKAHTEFQDNDSTNGESRKDKLIRGNEAVLGILPKGSCSIFDSRLLHAGTSNKSESDSRALFYFSFKKKTVGYPGNPASIRTELGAAQIPLSGLIDDLDSFSKGKGHPMIDDLASRLR